MADEIRDRLRLPVGIGIFLMWVAAGIAAIVREDIQVFVIASGPFGMLCGYLFTADLLRRAQNGRNGG